MQRTPDTPTPRQPAPRRSIAGRAGRWSAHHKKTAVFGWLAFVALAFVLGGMVGTKKLEDADTGVGESGRADQVLERAFPADVAEENILVQAPAGASARDPDVRRAVDDLTATVRELPGVSEVVSPYEQGGAVSEDGRSVLIGYELRDTEEEPAVDEISAINAQIAKAAKEYPTLRVEPFGDATAEEQIEGQFEEDFQRAELLSLPITLLILVIAFGALVAAGLPLLLGITAVIASLGLVALPSQILPVDDAISSVILLIGMAVGVDYSLFYLRREREERAKGRTTEEAIDIAAATSGKAILISGLTVIIAMSGMFLTGDKTFMSFGVGTIIVVAAAMVGSITVVPAMLSWLGPKVDKGRVPFLGRRPAGDSKVWGAILTPVLRFPLPAALLAAALLVGMALPALQMKTATSGLDTLPRSLPVMQTYDRVQEAFPGEPIPAVVAVQAADVNAPDVVAAIDRMVEDAEATGLFGAGADVTVAENGEVAAVTIPMKGDGSDTTSLDGLSALREDIIPATLGAAGVTGEVTGFTAGSEDWNEQMRGAAPLVFGFVLTLAFLLLMVTFRSVVIPLTGIAMNLLSVAAAYGALVWVFQFGNLEGLLGFDAPGAVTSWLPIFLFVILFGLSMDYHVFILSRIKEARDAGLSTKAAISSGIRSTAGVVTSAAVVMVAVFSIFGSLSMIEMKQMGVGLAVAILLDATIVRGVLLPAVMQLLGEANWYLPRWLQWLPEVDHGAGDVMEPAREPVTRPAPEAPRAGGRLNGRPQARREPEAFPLWRRAAGCDGYAAGMEIRAAVLEEFAQPLQVTTLDLAGPKAGEVLVRLHACGVCHTDMYSASGVDPSGYAPCVLGHEGAGVVEAVGEGVTSVEPGDHVVTLFSPQCGQCVNCRSGRTNICVAIREQQNQGYLPDGTARLSRDGEPIRHFMGCSTFAEATVVSEFSLAKVSKDAPLETAALFACGLSTGLGAAMYRAKVWEGSTAVVFGAGMVGLGAVAGARLQGAERIICVDLSEDRLELARHHGATDGWVAGDDVVDRVLEETGGYGADFTFEATGLVGVMRQAVESARMGWGVCCVTGVAGKGETLDIVPRYLITGRTVMGASFGGVKGRDQVPELVDRYLAGDIDADAFISHRISLDDINKGFDLMHHQDGIRSVVTFT